MQPVSAFLLVIIVRHIAAMEGAGTPVREVPGGQAAVPYTRQVLLQAYIHIEHIERLVDCEAEAAFELGMQNPFVNHKLSEVQASIRALRRHLAVILDPDVPPVMGIVSAFQAMYQCVKNMQLFYEYLQLKEKAMSDANGMAAVPLSPLSIIKV